MHLDNTKLVIPVSVNVSLVPFDSTHEPSLKPSVAPSTSLLQKNVVGEVDRIVYWPQIADFGTLGDIDSLERVPIYMTLLGPSSLVARIVSAQVDSMDIQNSKNNMTVHLVRTSINPSKVKSSRVCDKVELSCMATALGPESGRGPGPGLGPGLNPTDGQLRAQYLDRTAGPHKQLVAYVDFELVSAISGVVSGNISFSLSIGDEVSPVTVSIPFRATLLLGGVGFSSTATQFLLPVSNRTHFPHPFDYSYRPVPGSKLNEKDGKPFCSTLKNEDQKKPLDGKAKSKGEKLALVSDEDSNCVTNGRGECVGNSGKPISLTLTNYYNQPLFLVDASVLSCGSEGGSPLFRVTRIDRSVVARGGESWPAVELEFDLKAALLFQEFSPRDLPFVCYLSLSTSVSELRLPLYITDGSVRLVHVNAVSISCNLLMFINIFLRFFKIIFLFLFMIYFDIYIVLIYSCR